VAQRIDFLFAGMVRILCVGAHPDDVEIGMGGTVASLTARGIGVRILDLTNGEPTPRGSPEKRLEEAGRSAGILGAERRTLEMPNRFLTDSIENRKTLAAEIRDFKPEYVFAPYSKDAHPDHIAASALCIASRFYAKLTKSDIVGAPHFPWRLIHYFPVHVRLRIAPTFLTDISGTIARKHEAIRCYESQFGYDGKEAFIENIINENKYWGFQGGCAAAEPFYQDEIPLMRNWPEGYL